MAGGEGTRLRPLSLGMPKPMVPLLGRPVMEHIIGLLKRHGIDEIAVTLCYMPEAVQSYFGDGQKWGVRLHYFIEEQAFQVLSQKAAYRIGICDLTI